MVGLAGACRSSVERAAPLYGRLSPLSRPRRVRRARQSIYQDVKEEKLKGVMSLIKYTTLCQYMLVPTEETELEGNAATYPEDIPGYGARGWCRAEYFVFSLWAEMVGREQVELYAIKRDGSLHQYPQVKVEDEEYMPSGGALSNPNDKGTVKGLEDTMIVAYGKALAVKACEKGAGSAVDLSKKMIRAVHVDALGKAVNKHRVASLNLKTNQLGAEGAQALATVLRDAPTLTSIE